MGTDEKRLDKIEALLRPREFVALWVQELAKFNSMDEYVRWMSDDSSRAPLSRMIRQIKNRITKHSDVRSKDKDLCSKLFRKWSGEVVFLYHLLFGANEHVRDFLGREEIRVTAIMLSIQAVNERADSRMAMFDLWKGLYDTPYPLDPDTAAAVSAALRNGVTSFADLLANEEDSSESTCERLKASRR